MFGSTVMMAAVTISCKCHKSQILIEKTMFLMHPTKQKCNIDSLGLTMDHLVQSHGLNSWDSELREIS